MADQRASRDVGNKRLETMRAATTTKELAREARATQSISDAPSSPPSITAATASMGCSEQQNIVRR